MVEQVKRAPVQSTPRYVCARIRKILAAQGWPMSKTTGAYSEFGGTQKTTKGFVVHKVGCSKSVAIHYSTPATWTGESDKREREEMQDKAWTLLRKLGYTLDEKGWLVCMNYDACD